MQRICILILLSIFSICSFSQNSGIDGVVIDKLSKETLPGVHILWNEEEGTVSDINGAFHFELPPGNYLLKISSVGYVNYQINISLTGNERKNLKIELSPKSQLLNTVVITANRFAQSVHETTVSMEVIKVEEIEHKNPAQIENVLQQTSGVTIVDNEPQIRSGSGFSFGAGSRVQFLVDDMPLLSGDAGRPTYSFLPLENIAQIEIIKGASSVLYGSSALSGVIHFRTSLPGEVPQTKVNLLTGRYSDPENDGAVWWNKNNSLLNGFRFYHGRKIKNWSLSLSANTQSDQGFIGPEIKRDTINFKNSETKNGNFGNHFRVNFHSRYTFPKKQGMHIGLKGSALTGSSTVTLLWLNSDSGLYRPFGGSATRTLQTTYHLDPYLEFMTSGNALHKIQGRYYYLLNDNENNQSNESKIFYGSYQLQKPLSKDPDLLKLNFGITGNKTLASSDLFAGDENLKGENQSSNLGTYIQLNSKLMNTLNLTGGIRWEAHRVNEVSDESFIFRAGANYQIFEGTYIRLSSGQGFRFPTIAEKFIATEVGGLIIYPSFNLVSEKSWNHELGLRQLLKINQFQGFFDVALFQQEFENFIEFVFGQWATPTTSNALGLGFKSSNTGESVVKGIELTTGASTSIGNWSFTTTIGYTYTIPKTKSPDFVFDTSATVFWQDPTYLSTSSNPANNILKYRMQHAVRASIGASNEGFSFSVNPRYNSNMQNIDLIFEQLDVGAGLPASLAFHNGLVAWRQEKNKGDVVIDTQIGYRINNGISIDLIVNNLMNRTYAIRPLAIESPRLIMLQIGAEF